MQRYKQVALEILHYLKEEEAKRTDPVKDPVLPTSNRVYQELLDKLAPREGMDDKYTREDIDYNYMLLEASGYIQSASVISLTWNGYDLLEDLMRGSTHG